MNNLSKHLLTKTLTILVMVSFLIQPMAVFAEEANTEAKTEETVVEAKEVVNEGEMVEGETMNTSSGDKSYVQEHTGKESQKKVKGTTGEFLVDNFSGAATYSYEFDLPQGRSGVTPSLGISYNSHNANNQGGLIGAGWQLSQSYVVRQNKTGFNNLYNDNSFGLVFNGEQMDLVLVDPVNGIYAPKVETDFIKISYATTTGWTVFDKKGWQYIFGDTSLTQQSDPNNQTKIYSWWLRQIKDNNENTINYSYYKSDGQIYPKTINYTGREQQLGDFEVRFEPFYSGPQINNIRPDVFTKYTTAYPVTVKYRLEKIETYVSGEKKNIYNIDYVAGQNGKTSLLKSIQQTAFLNNNPSYLPKVNFEYTKKTPVFTDVTNQYPIDQWKGFAYHYPYTSLNESTAQLMEFSSDSWLDRAGAFYDGKKWVGGNLTFPEQITGNLPENLNRYSLIGDINNDGKNDIIYSISNGVHYNKMWLNAGDHFEPGWTLPDFFYQTNWHTPMSRLALVDVNGDGFSDIINAYREFGNSWPPRLVNEIWLNTGSGFVMGYGAFPTYLAQCQANVIFDCPGTGVQFMDVNSDGLVDVFIGTGAYINSGNGFLPLDETYGGANTQYEFSKGGSRLVDLDSDGLLDVSVSYEYIGNGITQVKKTFINTGGGFVQNDSWNIPEILVMTNHEFRSDYGTRFVDINNDGGVDLVRKYCIDDIYCGAHIEKPHKVYEAQPGKANLLKSIKIESGSQTDVSYIMSSIITDENGNYLNKKLPTSMPVVNSITINDGLGNINQTNFQYAYGSFYVDQENPNDNQFGGFGVVTIESGQKKIKKFFHQGGGFDGSAFGEDEDSVALKGREYREEIYNKNFDVEQLEKISLQKWSRISIGNRSKVQLNSAMSFNDKNELISVQPKINSAFNKAVSKYVSPAKTEYDLVKENDKKYFANENVNQPQLISEISDTNARHYYVGQNSKGYEYIGLFGIDSYLTTTTTTNSFGDGDICVTKNNNEKWKILYNQSSGDVSTDDTIKIINYSAGLDRKLCRGFFSFDVSSIPIESTIIEESKVQLYVASSNIDAHLKFAHASIMNPPTLGSGDYSRISFEPYIGHQTYATTTGKYIVSELGTSSVLSLNGYSTYGVRGPKDWPDFSTLYNYSSDFRITSSRSSEIDKRPMMFVRYITQSPLTRASNLMVNGQVNPVNTREPIIFSAKYQSNDQDSFSDYYRIQLINSAGNFDNPLWDSQKQKASEVGVGQVVNDMEYIGPRLLIDGSEYKWRIKFWDNNGNEGLWSIEDVTFSTRLIGVGSEVSYEYDPITQQVIKENNHGKGIYDLMTGELIENIVGDEQTVNYEYAVSNGDKPIVNAIKQKSVSGVGESVNYRTQAHYDNLPYGQVSKNNKTKDDFIVQQINQRYEYNNYGLPIKQIDPTGKETRYEYDANNLYPTKIYNALNQSTTVEYDLSTGQPTLTIDPNGVREERSYDAFGRVVSVKKSSPTDSNQMLEMERYSYDDYSMPKVVKKEVRVDGSNWLTTVEYYDGLGQNIQTRTKHNDKNEYVVVSNKYDNFGRVIKTTLPYLQMEEKYVAEDWNKPVTEKVYDALDRVTKETLPIGENNFAYDNFITTITDANGVQKKLERDAYDRLIAVEEFIDGNFVKTKYSYNVLGKLTKIVDSQNNEREFVYDDLGRLLSQTEAHKPNTTVDPWTYEYDQASRITKQTDPNGNQMTYDYDDLGRVTKQRTLAGEINYEYDNGENAVGRLVNVVSNYGVGYQKHMNYDLWGRVINEDVVINEKPFNSAFEYSLSGQVLKAVQPNQVTIENIYDNQGRFIGFNVIDPERQPRAVIKNVTYHLSGRPSEVFYANSTITNYDYDAQTQRLVNKLTTAKDRKIQSLNYQYDVLGNIIEINDDSKTLTAKKVNYDYDSLSRLIKTTAVNTAGGCDYEETYSYDSLGNILNKSDIGDYLYGNANPHQATTIGDKSYFYDRSGNVVNDGLYEYIYNPENRMVNANALDNSLLSEYSYDPAGTRVYKKVTTNNVTESKVSESVSSGENKEVVINETKEVPVEPVLEETKEEGKLEEVSEADLKISAVAENTEGSVTTETYYPNSFYELMVVGDKESPTIHVYGLGQRLAQLETVKDVSNIKLIFTDHLGSTQQVTDDTGALLTTYDYYSFGGVRVEDNNDGTNKKGFIGKELDETKLNYVEARYLNASTGKFIQVDPVIISGDKIEVQQIDPQSFNSYSYSRNNPIVLADKDGEFWHIVAGAALGAAISGGVTYWQTGSVKQAAAAAAGGAVSGAIIAAAAPATLFAATIAGGGANAVGGTVTRALSGDKVSIDTVANDTAIGAASGALGYGVGKAVGKIVTNFTNKPKNIVQSAPKTTVEKNVFPANSDELLPDLPRTQNTNGNTVINAANNLRIRAESHPLINGETYSPRHHGQHYHVEIRINQNLSWNNSSNIKKVYPPGYTRGSGSGFLPGEEFPK